MKGSARAEQFVTLFTRHQRVIYAYILSLAPSAQDADDIFQETNLVLWRKSDQFEPGSNFTAWACRIAYFEVLSHFKRNRRDKLRFDHALLSTLADEAIERAEQTGDRLSALRDCLGSLPDRSRDLVVRRYSPGATVEALAEQLGRTANSVSVSLHRVRRALLRCIEQRISTTT